MSKEKQIEILQLFLKLEKVDKNALANLRKLVAMAETTPAKYKLALNFL